MRKQHVYKGGFALPTVLMASIVMLAVLAVSVSSVAAVRVSLKAQYYEQLAKEAGEAGVAYANACLSKNSNVPLWTDDKPLTPATDCAGNTQLDASIQAVVVGGGGGGGSNHGGGGGGGGVKTGTYAVTPTSYSVTVGGGGAGGVTTTAGSQGGSSSLGSLLSVVGGGGGGARINGTTVSPPGNGSSGGGGVGTLAGVSGGNGTVGQGYNGGMGSANPSGNFAGNAGGGGGAGALGGSASGIVSGDGYSGDGGIGILSDISGQQIYYGGGGSGGRYGPGTIGIPGLTGGAIGGENGGAGSAGQANTGGGGGGGANGSGAGGAGGSGVVVIRYADNGSVIPDTGSMTGTYTNYTVGPYQVWRFTSSGTFAVADTGSSSCPTDPRCDVLVGDGFRSSFSVGDPVRDADGKALSIPNNGYVELVRASNGAVWRTYKQPAVQAAVVSDLCSGAAASGLGWSNAVVLGSSQQSSLPNAATARTISIADSAINAGYAYYRKDFTVADSGSYTVSVQTPRTSNLAQVYIDGVYMSNIQAKGQISSDTKTLSAGCHTMLVRLTNITALANRAQFIAAVQASGSEPIVATDSTWRVAAGNTVHFSQSDYYADSSVWLPPPVTRYLDTTRTTWTAVSTDPLALALYPSCDSSCPQGYTFFRASTDIVLPSDTEVTMSYICDNTCIIYVDGQPVGTYVYDPDLTATQTFTLTGNVAHRVGVALYNIGSSSKMGLSIRDKSTDKVYARTDASWTMTDQWTDGLTSADDPKSYATSFLPSPLNMPNPTTYDLMVVAGGGGGGGACTTCGGGGGGGGGGVIYNPSTTATVGAYTVTVGGGGAGGVGGASRTRGTTGSDSIFGSNTAKGGGGGGAQNTSISAGLLGGSGGGGASGATPIWGPGGAGTAGQGYAGGTGIGGTVFNAGGGGGSTSSGVAGLTTSAGNGGSGYMLYLVGDRNDVGAGGGGGTYGTASTLGNGDFSASGDGGSYNVNSGIGYAGTTNRGGGGGGGAGSPHGAAGGAGGSGLIALRFVKNSLTYTVSGVTYSASDVTISGTIYTVLKFSSGTGTFTITAVN